MLRLYVDQGSNEVILEKVVAVMRLLKLLEISLVMAATLALDIALRLKAAA